MASMAVVAWRRVSRASVNIASQHRVTLLRHGAAADLAHLKRFFDFGELGLLQVNNLMGDLAHRRPDHADDAGELGENFIPRGVPCDLRHWRSTETTSALINPLWTARPDKPASVAENPLACMPHAFHKSITRFPLRSQKPRL